jgi:hypothetical protein
MAFVMYDWLLPENAGHIISLSEPLSFEAGIRRPSQKASALSAWAILSEDPTKKKSRRK